MNKTRFYLYTEYIHFLEGMDIADQALLFRVILQYEGGLEVEEMTPAVKAVFSMIKNRLDNNREEYGRVCDANRKNGKKGGRPKTENNRTEPKITEENRIKPNETEINRIKPNKTEINQTEPNETEINRNKPDNDNDNDKDNDKENEIKNNKSDSNESDRQKPQADFRRAVELWNGLQDLGIKPITRISNDAKRFDNLRARLRQYGLAEYENAINRIRGSDFLQGKHGGNPWQITFDWFVLPNNFPKVLDGNYDNKTAATGISNGKQSLGDAEEVIRRWTSEEDGTVGDIAESQKNLWG